MKKIVKIIFSFGIIVAALICFFIGLLISMIFDTGGERLPNEKTGAC